MSHRFVLRSSPSRLAGTVCAACFLAGCGQSRTVSTPGQPLNGSAPGGSATAGGAPATGGAPGAAGLRVIRPSDLPPPHATASVNNPPTVVPRPEGAVLTVPPGFTIAEWADSLSNPRIVTVAPNGDVFVAESQANRVTVLRDGDGDGRPETRSMFADGLRQPFGIALYPPGPNPTHVYVANTDSVVRYAYSNGQLKASGAPETIVPDLPGGGYNQHWTRNVVFRPDGAKMYVSVGSQGNVAEEEEKRAAVLEYNPDGSGYRVFAAGLRNPVGLAFNPVGGALWAAVNERDGLGDDLVPDYATAVRDGGFYGWPWYYIGQNRDPRMAEKPDRKARTLLPDVLFESHSAALGIDFYNGALFPASYRNSAFVALHGSWNRSARSGYLVARIPFGAGGKPVGGYEEFVTGWKTPDGKVWGRPVDVAVAADGSLLITDDGAGKIWRVTYGATKQAARP